MNVSETQRASRSPARSSDAPAQPGGTEQLKTQKGRPIRRQDDTHPTLSTEHEGMW